MKGRLAVHAVGQLPGIHFMQAGRQCTCILKSLFCSHFHSISFHFTLFDSNPLLNASRGVTPRHLVMTAAVAAAAAQWGLAGVLLLWLARTHYLSPCHNRMETPLSSNACRVTPRHVAIAAAVAAAAARFGLGHALAGACLLWTAGTAFLLAQQPEVNLGHRAGFPGFAGEHAGPVFCMFCLAIDEALQASMLIHKTHISFPAIDEALSSLNFDCFTD